MTSLFERPLTRRRFLESAATVSAGAALAACAPPGATGPKSGGKKQLRILQWSHFIPPYDEWMKGFVADWGSKNKVDATIDFIATDDLPARMAAEVASKSGHDLIEMNGQILTHLYEKQLLDMGDIVDYAIKKHGQPEPLAKQLGQVNGTWRGWPNYYIAIVPIVRADYFQSIAGVDYKSVKTWDQYLDVGAKLKAAGHPAGFAISHCNDANHNWRAIMWAFGASEVAADGKTVTVDSPEMKTFLKFAQEFHRRANEPEVFAWDNAADNRHIQSGVGGYIHDAISSMRSIQTSKPDIYNAMQLSQPIAGPAKPNGISMPDANVYTIWNFTPKDNQDTAKEFLKYYIDNYEESFKQSTLYNQPFYADRFKKDLFPDPKFAILQNYRGDRVQTFGYPGPPTYEASLVLANYVIPDMVGIAVKKAGDAGIKDAIDFAKTQMKRHYPNYKG